VVNVENSDNRYTGEYADGEEKIVCVSCALELAVKTVTLSYMNGSFPVELLSCPKCGYTYIPEHLAVGKMLRVEKELEDK
jgi:hypothetical protein